MRPGSWSRGASRTKMKVLDHEVLVLNIWSWSWRKSLAVFQDFCCNSWRQWARQTMAFCERQQKQFAIRKPLFERTFCAPCTSASVERVFNNGGCLLVHTDASKAQCIDCGKLLSLDSNKPGKQTVHGLKCYLEESGIPSTRTTCKKGKTGRGIGGALQGWQLVAECMKKKEKTLYYQVTFVFVFRLKMNVHFRFVFSRKWNFIFVGIFIYGRKWKMLFGRPLVYITKRSWSWDAKFWSWSWTLGLVLVLKEF